MAHSFAPEHLDELLGLQLTAARRAARLTDERLRKANARSDDMLTLFHARVERAFSERWFGNKSLARVKLLLANEDRALTARRPCGGTSEESSEAS